MSRPRKWRNVCGLPTNTEFGPLNQPKDQQSVVVLAIDEYETLRLIDLEGFTQEECALQMNIARTTVQKIYSDARKKVADSLVNSKTMLIDGGNYQVCDGLGRSCSGRGCQRHRHGRDP